MNLWQYYTCRPSDNEVESEVDTTKKSLRLPMQSVPWALSRAAITSVNIVDFISSESMESIVFGIKIARAIYIDAFRSPCYGIMEESLLRRVLIKQTCARSNVQHFQIAYPAGIYYIIANAVHPCVDYHRFEEKTRRWWRRTLPCFSPIDYFNNKAPFTIRIIKKSDRFTKVIRS